MAYQFNPGSVISAENSTTTPLNTGAVFTGTWIDCLNYSSVVVAVKSDQDGTYSIQYSPDGTNLDSTLTRYYRTGQIEPPHRFTNTRRFLRVVFTNTTANNQSYIRLQTILGDRGELNAPSDAVLSQDFDAVVVRPTDYHYETALGRRQGQTTWNKFGYNSDIDVAAEETIWAAGGTFVPMVNANTLTVSSNSTFDSTSSNAASGVVIYGIDQNRKAVIEVVTLQGTSNVETTNQFLGVNRMAVYATNGSGFNIGTITAKANVNQTIQATIPPRSGTTQQMLFFTQSGHQALLDWIYVTALRQAAQNPKLTIKGIVYSFVSRAQYEVFRLSIDTSVENHLDLKPSQPFVIGANSIFYMTAESDKADTEISARCSLIEVKDAGT